MGFFWMGKCSSCSQTMPPKTFGQDNADAKVKVMKNAQEKSENPKFKDMVIDAITTQKERSGSSLSAIKNHLASKYKVDLAKKSGILNRQLKKMGDEGVLVRGAQPGRKGAGCFKLSAEEKGRMADAAKVAARKLKAQSKHGFGKVSVKAPKKTAKKCLGKEKGASTGKKNAAKKAGPKSSKSAKGKLVANAGVKKGMKLAAKTNKDKLGKVSKK